LPPRGRFFPSPTSAGTSSPLSRPRGEFPFPVLPSSHSWKHLLCPLSPSRGRLHSLPTQPVLWSPQFTSSSPLLPPEGAASSLCLLAPRRHPLSLHPTCHKVSPSYQLLSSLSPRRENPHLPPLLNPMGSSTRLPSCRSLCSALFLSLASEAALFISSLLSCPPRGNHLTSPTPRGHLLLSLKLSIV